MATAAYGLKYKDTISDFNSEWSKLLHAYKIKDTRVEYLYSFEQVLALNCPFSLWENPRYFRVTSKYPIPEQGYTSLKKFRLYMMLYYYLMLDAGLLKMNVVEEDDSDIGSDAFTPEARA